MQRKIVALIIFLFPSRISMFCLKLFGYKIGKNCKIGFSWIDVKVLELEDKIRIGHGNFICVTELHMGIACVIKRFNIVKGNICLTLKRESVVNQFNYITNAFGGKKTCCLLDTFAIIGVAHTIDLTSNFSLGSYSILAGKGSQVWTHGFYHSKKMYEQRWRIDGEVVIGDNVYIGSRVVICAGVSICRNCTIGAGVIVSKSLFQEGLYVNQALRFIEFDPEETIKKLKKVREGVFEK